MRDFFTGLVAIAVLSGAMPAPAQVERDDFVSEASYVVGTFEPTSREHSPEAIAKAANAFVESLDDAQRTLLVHDLRAPERTKWTNVPQRENGGLALGKCNEQQVKEFCNMLAALLSEQGYTKMVNIMLADDQLISGGRRRTGFGTEDFYVVLFGTPSPTKPWGFQFDGHHLGVNLSIEGEKITMAPSFIGTQPEVFQLADKKIRPLAEEIDVAFELVTSLNEEQRQKAVVSKERGNLVTGPGNDEVPELPGIPCSSFDQAQEKMLLRLISQWVNDLPEKQANERMKQIERELDKTRFGWRGPLEEGQPISYMIQGPSLIIEYAVQNAEGSHIHTMYRDPTNPYGKQLAGE